MGVTVRAMGVLVPVRRLEERWPGGEAAYRAAAPNQTYHCDGYLAAVDFMAPGDVAQWIEELAARAGLVHLRDGVAADVVVVQRDAGPTTPCDWIECEEGPRWLEVRLSGAPPTPLTGPRGWAPGSATDFQHFSDEEAARRLCFLGTKGNAACFRDQESGELLYIGVASAEGLAPQLYDRLAQILEGPLRIARRALDRDPDPPAKLKPRVLEYGDEAERIAREVEALGGMGYYTAALAATMGEDYRQGIRRWRIYLAGAPEEVEAWKDLTLCLGMAGETEEALGAAEQAVALAPDDPVAVTNLAGSLLEAGRHAEAGATARRALALDPDDRIAAYILDAAQGEREP